MYKYVRKPYPHVGHVGFLAEKSFIGHLIPSSGADGLIHGVHDCHECISPEEVWGPSVLHDSPPLVKDLAVGSLSNAILLRHVQYGELKLDSTLSAVLLKGHIHILPTTVRLQDLDMGPIVVCEKFVKSDKPVSKLQL